MADLVSNLDKDFINDIESLLSDLNYKCSFKCEIFYKIYNKALARGTFDEHQIVIDIHDSSKKAVMAIEEKLVAKGIAKWKDNISSHEAENYEKNPGPISFKKDKNTNLELVKAYSEVINSYRDMLESFYYYE